jgi:hypothetical protein
MTDHTTRDGEPPKNPKQADEAASPGERTNADEQSSTWNDTMFNHNPAANARSTMLAEVRRMAAMAASEETALGHARVSVAMHALLENRTDDDTADEVAPARRGSQILLAGAPAMSLDDVRSKLAGLVLELARDANDASANPLALTFAACALADLTILRRDPTIPVPKRAFEPIDNPEIIDYWRRFATGKAGEP